MKLWQWFGCWLAFEVAKKQAWIDAPDVPAWVVWTLFALVLVAHFGAKSFATFHAKALDERTEREGKTSS